MALVLADRVLETTTSTGSGTITLAGAKQGYQSFAAIGDGNQTYYTIASQSEWEVGIGTYTSSGTTLSRDSVLSSSNSNTKVTFSAGTKDVFVTYPSEKSVVGNVYLNETTFSIPYLVDSGRNGLSVGPITITSGNSVTVSSGQRWVVI
jgi:hypothetical protein